MNKLLARADTPYLKAMSSVCVVNILISIVVHSGGCLRVLWGLCVCQQWKCCFDCDTQIYYARAVSIETESTRKAYLPVGTFVWKHPDSFKPTQKFKVEQIWNLWAEGQAGEAPRILSILEKSILCWVMQWNTICPICTGNSCWERTDWFLLCRTSTKSVACGAQDGWSPLLDLCNLNLCLRSWSAGHP